MPVAKVNRETGAGMFLHPVPHAVQAAPETCFCKFGRHLCRAAANFKFKPMYMQKPFQISRRSFLHKSAMVAAATGLPVWFVQRELEAAEAAQTPPVTSPNDRPGIALIGCGGQGTGDAGNAQRWGD